MNREPQHGRKFTELHWRKFTKPGHHDIVTFAWWCAAGTLTIISTALYGGEIAVLSAANPATRLPWIGWPANIPRSAKVLHFFALLPLVIAADCVYYALGRRRPYDALWGFLLLPIVLGVTVGLQVRHNRRVRNAA